MPDLIYMNTYTEVQLTYAELLLSVKLLVFSSVADQAQSCKHMHTCIFIQQRNLNCIIGNPEVSKICHVKERLENQGLH